MRPSLIETMAILNMQTLLIFLFGSSIIGGQLRAIRFEYTAFSDQCSQVRKHFAVESRLENASSARDGLNDSLGSHPSVH
jgi:hypothetical protein